MSSASSVLARAVQGGEAIARGHEPPAWQRAAFAGWRELDCAPGQLRGRDEAAARGHASAAASSAAAICSSGTSTERARCRARSSGCATTAARRR